MLGFGALSSDALSDLLAPPAAGTLAYTEGADVSVASGSITTVASGTPADGADVSTANGNVASIGTANATDGADVSVASGTLATNGTLNTLDGTDIIAAYGGTPAANSTPYEATLNLSMMRLGGMVR